MSPLGIHAQSKAAIQKIMSSTNRQGVKHGKGFKSARNQLTKKSRASVGAECKPDVGVLSCGMGMYCKSDDSSSLGGVCAPLSMGGRKLEDSYADYFCVAYADDFDCDCSAWDATSSSGYLSCDVFSGYCFEGCPNICLDAGGTYTSDGENWEYTTCLDFTAPYEQHYCQTAKSDGTCEITLDGEACTSCEMVSECGSFDCENVGMGSGSFCDDDSPVPPIFQYCAVQGPYDPCYICPNGMANPDTLVGTPEDGYYSCSTLGAYAELGFVDATYCYALQIALNGVCCGGEIYVCNICGEEGLYVTQMDGYVSIPGATGSYRCDYLLAASEAGLISSQVCGLMPAFASTPCGCAAGTLAPGSTMAPVTSPAPTAPTETETDAPSTSPTMKEGDTVSTPSPTVAPTTGATPTTPSPTVAPTAASGVTPKFAVTAVACATALVAMFSF
eukprot:Nitzschia sp. Nitz4//scaffold54_size114964//66735//68184//NITZ4_003855-RA/size114964-augustus-gene-0.50-mRNA-1//1//CDS//3329554363//7481//frame0